MTYSYSFISEGTISNVLFICCWKFYYFPLRSFWRIRVFYWRPFGSLVCSPINRQVRRLDIIFNSLKTKIPYGFKLHFVKQIVYLRNNLYLKYILYYVVRIKHYILCMNIFILASTSLDMTLVGRSQMLKRSRNQFVIRYQPHDSSKYWEVMNHCNPILSARFRAVQWWRGWLFANWMCFVWLFLLWSHCWLFIKPTS